MLGLLLLAVAAGLLVAGAELFTDNAAAAGQRLGVTGLAVGLLLAGAEPEELLTAVTAAVRDRPGLAVGNAVGANVTICTLVLGLAAVIRPVPLGGRVRSFAAVAAGLGALAALTLLDGRVSRPEAVLLVAAYAGLVALVWWRERQPPPIGDVAELTAEPRPQRRPALGLCLALAGIAVMTSGGWLAVAGAERLVELLGAEDSGVGLTLLALATTAELLALVWSAGRRELPDLAVAGLVGSAAYNSTVTLGGAALARPLAGQEGLVAVSWLAGGLPLAVLALGLPGRRLGRPAGAVLLAGYAGYLYWVLPAP